MKMWALMLNLDVYSKCRFQMFVRDVDFICLMLMSMLMFAAKEPLIQISQLGRQACLVKSTFWDAL